jgi:hypothetical protein
LLAALALLLITAAAAQAQSLQTVLAKARITAEERAAVAEQFNEAERQGIPPVLLLPRLEEGVAKKAAAPRLLEALRRETELLLQARALLQELPAGSLLLADPSSWARTANLLSGALSAGEVRELVGLCGERPTEYRPATALYVSLLQWGLERLNAMEILRGLLAGGYPGESFPGIMSILLEGRKRRLQPEVLVRRLLEQLPQTTDLDELQRRVLE